jgi:hypothetical protein
MAEQNTESSLNEAEAELYDRQLRLWGLEAQQRMQKSKILFCGIRGLLAEVSTGTTFSPLAVVYSNLCLIMKSLGCC